ncbi:hypothetical protein GCM10017083_53140 [Thalassobaculum fulvum]|uniref:Transglycosylase SLT domain-containing protein n=2 Tax=Thalassobaculum fulvum TaxID=1633335 RepID=A0A919CSP2_9PROT|nr:hypothetical protein GCM10017083_53140 [Thalassobaculum fulvum]
MSPAMRRSVGILAVVLALLAAGDGRAAGVPDAGDGGRAEIRRIVVQEALRSERVPPSLALAVAEAESNFDPGAESRAGARGVMQIMPATGRGEFGVEPDALWQPRLNVQLGIAFLDRLIGRYGDRWDLALSHYNGGSRVGSGAAARVIPATRGYVDKVLRLERRYARDETVRRMVAAAGAPPERVGASERLPVRAVAAARLAEAEAGTVDWRPADRRRRFLALAERALAGADARHRRLAAEPGGDRRGSAGILAGIEARKQRFRALLATLRDG